MGAYGVCLAALPGNRPKSAFFALFLPFSPFSGGCEEHLGNAENGGKGPFSSDILRFAFKPPSLKLPFAALQGIQRYSGELREIEGNSVELSGVLCGTQYERSANSWGSRVHLVAPCS